MLTTTGAKSGKLRTVPVVGLPTDEGVAVIASNYGQEKHPAWFYNLSKNPDAEVGMDERSWKVRAVEVGGRAAGADLAGGAADLSRLLDLREAGGAPPDPRLRPGAGHVGPT